MASGAEQHDVDIQQMMAAQVQGLVEALGATQEIAAEQGCGVTVVYERTAVPEMKVSMFVDPELAVGEVRYTSEFADGPWSPPAVQS